MCESTPAHAGVRTTDPTDRCQRNALACRLNDDVTTRGAARARRAIWGGALCLEADHTMKDARGTSFPQLTACPIPGVADQSCATTARRAHVMVMRRAKRVVPPLVVRGRVARERVGD